MPDDPTPPARVPELRIITPDASISQTTAASITVAGTASDEDGIALVTVSTSTNPTAVSPAINASGTTAWSKTVALDLGDNTITVKAHTNAGAMAWADVTVVRTADSA